MATEHDRAVLNSIFNPLMPVGEAAFTDEIPPELTDNEEVTPEVLESRKIELEGVKAAESGEIEKALQYFTEAIKTAPSRASCYNNRAQALRLKGKNSDALVDLNNALNLCQGQGRTACQALCQRALLYLKEGQDELSRKDFEAAAKLGSAFAKSQLAQMNPYAALCNKMLHEAFTRLQRGEPDPQPKC
ncbi:hypothetical protein B566_EDAN001654 [Ephemera danica]|nr:hypothetical protein B566_EDAN001654 [Ephemera danica]